MRASDTILGAVTTASVGSGLGWLLNSPVLTATGMIATFGLAAIGWLVRKRELEDNANRNKWIADTLAKVQIGQAELQSGQAAAQAAISAAQASLVNVQVNQVLTADMMQRLHYTLHPETKDSTQPTVVQAPPAEEKKS